MDRQRVLDVFVHGFPLQSAEGVRMNLGWCCPGEEFNSTVIWMKRKMWVLMKVGNGWCHDVLLCLKPLGLTLMTHDAALAAAASCRL